MYIPCYGAMLFDPGLSPFNGSTCCSDSQFSGLRTQEEEEFELWPEWTLGPDTFAKNNELISNKRPRCIQMHPDAQAQVRSIVQSYSES